MSKSSSVACSCGPTLGVCVQLCCAASLLASVACAAVGVAALEQRRMRLVALHEADDTTSSAPYNFWLEDYWPRLAAAALALGLCDVNANAMALWAARLRSRWLLAPYLAVRATLGLGIAAFLSFQAAGILIGYILHTQIVKIFSDCK